MTGNKTICDRCRVECPKLYEIQIAFMKPSPLGEYQTSRTDLVCTDCHDLWLKKRYQHKDNFYKALPHKKRQPRCLRCDNRSRYLSGDPNSKNIFEDADGLCDPCFKEFLHYYEAQQAVFMAQYVFEEQRPKPHVPVIKKCYICRVPGDHTYEWYFRHKNLWGYLCDICYEPIITTHNNFFNKRCNESRPIKELDKEVYELYMLCKPTEKSA